MGMHFHSYVFYGFLITKEYDGIYELMEQTWERESKILIDSVGDGDYYYICAKESHIKSSDYNSDSTFIQLAETNKSEWDYELYKFCLEHNLLYIQPTWAFASGYS